MRIPHKLPVFLLLSAAVMMMPSCSDEPEPVVPDPDPVEEEDPGQDPDPDPEPEPGPEPQPSGEADPYVAGRLTIVTDGGAAITSKSEYVGCTVALDHDCTDWCFDAVPAGIRGRGNSSWEWYPKKPYRIKFDSKQEMLGLGKAKSWVLLAEYRDPTDLMNTFVFELAGLMGMPFTNHNRYVEVTLNGDYIGLYHLTEQVQQNKHRVNSDEAAGLLIELDRDDGPELAPAGAADNFWSEVYNLPVCVKNPEPADLPDVKSEFAELERAISDLDWSAVGRLMDVGSFIDFLIVQELVYNVELDAPRSMFMHRDVGGKWTMGPLWDFDAGFDFDWATMTTGHTYFANYRELVMGTDPANRTGASYRPSRFFINLFNIPEFTAAYKERWNQVRDMVTPAWEATRLYYTTNSDAWDREATRWRIDKDYAGEITRMETWLRNRTTFLSGIIASYPQ